MPKGQQKGGVEFFSIASKEALLSDYHLSKPAASIVKALTWHKTISPPTGSLRNEYAQIVPAVLREFLFHEQRLSA